MPRVACRHAAVKAASGACPRPASHERRDRLGRQRRRLQQRRRRLGGERRQHVARGAVVLGPGRDDERDGQLLQPRLEEHEEAQGGRVGPVGVVDREHERAARGEVGAQPVQAVEDGEGGVRAPAAPVLGRCRRRAREPEPLRGQAGGPGQQVGALVRRGDHQRRLEELAHDAVAELLLELGAAGAQDAHAGALGARPEHVQQRGLAHAGRALDDHQAPLALPRRRQGRVQAGELVLALEQHRHGASLTDLAPGAGEEHHEGHEPPRPVAHRAGRGGRAAGGRAGAGAGRTRRRARGRRAAGRPVPRARPGPHPAPGRGGHAAAVSDAPLVPGPVFGLRTWLVEAGPDGERLVGAHSRTPWPADGAWLEATCAASPAHPPPGPACTCGIYAWHPARAAAQRVCSVRREVPGIVEVAGPVEVHADGLRAARGRPRALVLLPGRNAGQLERLARAYGAELLRLDGAAALLAHCREHDLGLAAPVVERLVGPERIAGERRRRRRAGAVTALRVGAVALALVALGLAVDRGTEHGKVLHGRAGEVRVP